LVPVTGRYLLDHIESLTQGQVPVYQVLKNSEGALRADPVDPASARSLPPPDRDKKLYLIDKDWQQKLFSGGDTFAEELEPLLEESAEDRTKAVTDLRVKLAELKAQDAEPMVRAQAIMDTVSRAFLLNKASLKPKAAEVTVHEKTLARESESIVATALEMAEDPALVSGLFEAFQGLSNGQTVNHVTRVFASYTGFLRYYNHQHSQRLVATVRRSFEAVYAPAYRSLLPGLTPSQFTSDQILQLPAFEPLELKEYALGAFLHDIGKMGNIDYFESDAGWDPKQIQQHVYLGAGLVLMNYGNDHDGARLLTGDHHNALGRDSGYGVTRFERQRSSRPVAPTVRVLSGQSRPFVSGEALGWLPIEMLAVADVYDAMTDTSRTYKKGMSSSEAVVFLEETMAAQGKLDPLLVDLYIDYLRDQGVEVPAGRGFAAKVKSL